MKTIRWIVSALFVLAIGEAIGAQQTNLELNFSARELHLLGLLALEDRQVTNLTPLFPDTTKTPGVTRAVTAKAVCVPGSSKAVRNVPTSEKNAVYKEYGILHRAPGSYEIDHDISLELGGSNAIGNLWPEIFDINVNGFNEGAHTKDALENKLHSLMCAGKLTMKQAQDAIRGDWRPAYLKYVAPKFPPFRKASKKAPARPTSRNDLGARELSLTSVLTLSPSQRRTVFDPDTRSSRNTRGFDSARALWPIGNSLCYSLNRCRSDPACGRASVASPCLQGRLGTRTNADRPLFLARRNSGNCDFSGRSSVDAFQPTNRIRACRSDDAFLTCRWGFDRRVRECARASYKISVAVS